jgi:uncharacterized protein YbaR (Trm112 family)
MAISEQLLEILAVCPACRSKLDLKPDGSGEMRRGQARLSIRDDIPVMLIDEATVEDEQPAANS